MKTLPNQLLIEGHTDAAQYSTDANYSNWELSADRANSARRLLQQDGVRGDQVTQVRGYADQMLRVKSNPYDPSNRRISILVKNQDGALPHLGCVKRSGAGAAACAQDGGDNRAHASASGEPQAIACLDSEVQMLPCREEVGLPIRADVAEEAVREEHAS